MAETESIYTLNREPLEYSVLRLTLDISELTS